MNAEQFKASLVKPTGRENNPLTTENLFRGLTEYLKKMANFEDDEFFHITCHVDPSLKVKIEQGEYVDLERLLPKDCLYRGSDDQTLTLVNRDGNTYFVPSDNSSKFTNVRHWEQAFRVYAAV